MSNNNRSAQTIFVIDDDAPMRDALAGAFAADGYDCETFADAEQFLAAAETWPEERGGCLVLDAVLPGLSGLDLQDRLSAEADGLPIIFITGYGDIPMAVRAMKGGAVDFLPKPFKPKELLERAEAALRTDIERRKRRRARKVLLDRVAELTPRETQVFEKITNGQSNRAVALDFGISERTVEIHRGRVMRKMMAQSLPNLVHMKVLLDGPPV